jgi:hypothetical protein
MEKGWKGGGGAGLLTEIGEGGGGGRSDAEWAAGGTARRSDVRLPAARWLYWEEGEGERRGKRRVCRVLIK